MPPRQQPHASVYLLRALTDVVKQRGIDATYQEPVNGRVPLDDYQRILAHAAQRTGDPALGLHCGLHCADASFGLISPLISHAASLRQAIELVARFHPLLLDAAEVQLSECMGTATLRCEFPRVSAAADRSLAELIVAGLHRTLRAFGCMRREIHALYFEHARPSYHSAYTAAFGGTERFAHAFTGVEFAAEALDRLHIHRDPELAMLLRVEGERTLERLGRPASCSDRVLTILRRRRHGPAPEMQDVARMLGLSVRSLRRRLTEEGSSFRALEKTVLHADACALLRDPHPTLQGIAQVLGFADASAFHRAFKRWTGVTPAEYRHASESCEGMVHAAKT